MKAKELSFTAKTISGIDAKDLGIAIDSFPLEELNENVYNIALKIADNSPNSIKAYKDLYAAAQNNGLKKGLEYESNTSYDIPEVEERMRNFLTKLKS